MINLRVDGITNLISYDFKHQDTDLDCEIATFNVHKERQLKDITTDTFIEHMFSDSRPEVPAEGQEDTPETTANKIRETNRFNFLAFVYTYLNLQIKLELPLMLIEENVMMKKGEAVYLLFKGGNMMYYKYEELKSLVKGNLKEEFYDTYNDKFKISDFDFTCYITVQDRARFYKVKKVVNQILWRGTIVIRNFFESYLNTALKADVNRELDGEPPRQDMTRFKSLKEFLTENNHKIETYKEERKTSIKDRLLHGYAQLTPMDKHAYVLNKAMQISEELEGPEGPEGPRLNAVSARSFVHHLRTYLYRTTVFHKSPEKLSASFDAEYRKENEESRQLIILMYNKVTEYLRDLELGTKSYVQILMDNKDFHVPTLLHIYDFLAYVRQHSNIIFVDEVVGNNRIVDMQKQSLFVFLDTLIREVTIIFMQKIIDSDFYNIFNISNLLDNIAEKFEAKKNDLKVCESIYDEYQAFDGNVEKLKDEKNYNMILLEGKELEVHMQTREDFYIQPSLTGDSTILTDTSSKSFHYVYQNSTIKKVRNQYSSVVDFDLLRVKFNVDLVISPNTAESKTVKIPSEFIDISICNYDDSALTEFRNHTEDGLGLFAIKHSHHDENLTLECFGYSINSMVHDLIYVLYEQNLFTPWVDGKYEKRIGRLNALQFLSYIDDAGAMKKYLLSVLVVHIITVFAADFVKVSTGGKSEEGLIGVEFYKLFKLTSDNVIQNYKKYNLELVFNILPTAMLDVVYRNYLWEFGDVVIPYPDKIVGSFILYAILQSKYKQDNEGKMVVNDIINRYRHDFMYLPADEKYIEETISKSEDYMKSMTTTYSDMLEVVKKQIKFGGKPKKETKTTKPTRKSQSFF